MAWKVRSNPAGGSCGASLLLFPTPSALSEEQPEHPDQKARCGGCERKESEQEGEGEHA